MTTELFPVEREILSADKLIKVSEEQADNIDQIRFIPPKIGDTDFGRFEIYYTTPVFRKKTIKPLSLLKRLI